MSGHNKVDTASIASAVRVSIPYMSGHNDTAFDIDNWHRRVSIPYMSGHNQTIETYFTAEFESQSPICRVIIRENCSLSPKNLVSIPYMSGHNGVSIGYEILEYKVSIPYMSGHNKQIYSYD